MRIRVATMLLLSACQPFEPCGDGIVCVPVQVPADWSEPDGETFQLDVVVHPATKRRIGPLAMNYGGPGASATEAIYHFAETFPSLAERFNLVAVDPRGTEPGGPFEDCSLGIDAWLATDFDSLDAEEWPVHTEALGAWLADCRDAAPYLTGHMGTRDTVEDFEAVREALGGEPLTWVGYSYGTILGQMYAELHPEALRAVYLDGVARPGGTYLDFLDGQVAGFEGVYTDWQAWCAATPDDCPLSADPNGAIATLFDQLKAAPIARADGRDLTYGRAWHGVLGALYSDAAWPLLAQGVDGALRGESDLMSMLADSYLGWSGTYDPLMAGYFITSCSDMELPADEAEVQARAAAAATVSPLFGAGILTEPSGCLAAGLANDPLPDLVDAAGAPTVLLVAGEHDPATPYAVGLEVAGALDDARLLTWTGNGHVAMYQSQCVADAAFDYLIDLTLPDVESCP